MKDSIILIGASVRAAAQSAVRAGFAPWCADLFADRDLQAIAETRRVSRYPAGLVAALADAPDAPLVYTGALENYPQLIDALTIRRPLWGNYSGTLRGVRSPADVEEVLRQNGLPAPGTCFSPSTIPRDGTWLCKPLRSGGGWRIKPWTEPSRTLQSLHDGGRGSVRQRGGYYFQQRIAGVSCAALYVAAREEAVLLGVTRQLVGTTWTGAGPYSYAGSLGPLSLPPHHDAALRQIGTCLAEAFRLEGLFGVDAIVNDEGVWPVEVNPRYPASAEVLERAVGFSAMQLHANACAECRLPSQTLPPHQCHAGKAILFAAADFQVTQPLVDRAERENQGSAWPAVADVPHVGSHIALGSPVLTVLCEGTDVQVVEAQLRRQIATAQSLCEGI